MTLVLAECVFVLESFYKRSQTDISQILSDVIASPGIELSEKAVHLDALVRYENTNLHFVDCFIAASAVRDNISVATLDLGFRKFSDVRVNID